MPDISSAPAIPASPAKNEKIRAANMRTLLRRAVLLSSDESRMLDLIPDLLLVRILDNNFDGNMALAERVLFNRYDEIEALDVPALDQKKKAIAGLAAAAARFKDALIDPNRRVLVLTDNDNDGSMAQAVHLDLTSVLSEEASQRVALAYSQPVGSSRGLNRENIDIMLDHLGWDPSTVTVITADIGINNRVEQDRILEAYPGMDLIVTDHHLPVEGMVVVEGPRTLILNPQHKPTEFFKKKNISGASTFAVLVTETVDQLVGTDALRPNPPLDRMSESVRSLSAWSDLLDYVRAHLVNMPLRPHMIEKSLRLRSLLNVYNSVGRFADLDWTPKRWASLAAALPALDVDLLKSSVADVKSLNVYAGRLLALQDKLIAIRDGHTSRSEDQIRSEMSARMRSDFSETFDRRPDAAESAQIEEDAAALAKDILAGRHIGVTPKEFYAMLSEELLSEDPLPQTGNTNYISQLRPHIFRMSASESENDVMAALLDQMVSVFDDMRKLEKGLIKHLRTVEILDREKLSNSTIVFPSVPGLTEIIGRKMINKIYNEENNGFILTADSFSPQVFSGSMRSLYPISDILPDRDAVQDEFGVDLEILGHANAAGFKVTARPGTVIDRSLIARLNAHINTAVEQVRIAEKETLPFLNIDFGSVGLVQKINTAVKAHLSNMSGLPCVLKLPASSSSKSVHVTERLGNSVKQVDLSEVVSSKKYGYQPIAADFHGSAFIVPVELLRSISTQGFEPLLKLSYMDDGVMIAHQVADRRDLRTLVDFKGDRTDQRELIGYYMDTFRDSNFIDLTEGDFRSSPYFRFNSYGSSEYEHWEQFVISLLEETKHDVLCVTDTEGMGFGLPACFNIGGTNIRIKPDSGAVLPEGDFDRRMFRDASGRAWLLPDEAAQTVSDVRSSDGDVRLFKAESSGGVGHDQELFWPDGDLANAQRITNFTKRPGRVLFNRALDGFAFAYLVTNDDFAVTPEFENLTGISNEMVKRFGKPTEVVDAELTAYYRALKNPAGKPAKVIFAAHNLPYDKGVISANFQEFNTLLDEHLLCDTAKLARKAKLAYDDTPVSVFVKQAGLSEKICFYDSPQSSYSLTTFLDRAANGKNAIYPDVSGRYMLRYNPAPGTGKFSLIDRSENREVLLPQSAQQLRDARKPSVLPANRVKYSVERLSARAMIRNIILHDYTAPARVDLLPDEEVHRTALEFFQDQYHFDNSLDDNVRFFMISAQNRTAAPPETLVKQIADRFVEKNRDLQARFHDGWIYERVLALYEPDTLKISQDALDQVAYLTALPHEKIKKVLEDTVRFKQKFSLDSALVHEQHNNIRQHSPNGQGLSDTALESVLPGLLTIMKFYNPYTRSIDGAVRSFVDENIAGAMYQLVLKRDHLDAPAMDSFSMLQLQSIDREHKTSLVQAAQEVWACGGWDGNGTPIKFKLSAGVIPTGTGVYGSARRELSDDEIFDSSDRLKFILLNEQLRTAALLSKKLDPSHADRLAKMADANDATAAAHRTVLLDRFDNVEYMRRDATVKALSDLMKRAFKGHETVAPDNVVDAVRRNPDLLASATALEVTHLGIRRKMGLPGFLSSETIKAVSEFLADLSRRAQDYSIPVSDKKRAAIDMAQPYDGSRVRTANFLPDLDIRREEPMKSVLTMAGPLFFARLLPPPILPRKGPQKTF